MKFRRKSETAAQPDLHQAADRAAPPVPPRDERVALHLERAVIGLTARMQDVSERLTVVERHLDHLNDRVVSGPTNSDVMEVRVHSAKLAAELTRATVELRGQIGIVQQEVTRHGHAAAIHADVPFATGVIDINALRPDVDTSTHPAASA